MEEQKRLKDKVIEQFSPRAEAYFTSESHAKGNDLSLMVEWLQPSADWTVLDIATGGGHVARTLAPHVAAVFATDLTRDMLANTARHLREHHPNIWYVVADAESLPFLDGTFDLVTCRIAPHHFPRPELFVKEASRVLKPGGTFVLIDNVSPENRELADFHNTFEALRDESHVRCLTIPEWRRLFAQEGLTEIRSLVRKKTYVFPQWVERTAKDQEQIDRVYAYIAQATPEMQEYFSIQTENGKVKSLRVDEWFVVCKKTE